MAVSIIVGIIVCIVMMAYAPFVGSCLCNVDDDACAYDCEHRGDFGKMLTPWIAVFFEAVLLLSAVATAGGGPWRMLGRERSLKN